MKKINPTIIIGFVCFIFSVTLNAQRTIGKATDKRGPYHVDVFVEDLNSLENLPGASILIKERGTGDITDNAGYVAFSLEKGIYNFEVTYLGYRTKEVTAEVLGRGSIKFRLEPDAQLVDEIIISSEAADANVKDADIGKQVMSIETIESIPPFVGEADILKSITLLPGVSTVGEASSGFNVRGSNSDQNLILLGGAPLYNPSHLFGFFSAFNTDLIQDISIYKGGIPANYGGRAASIIDLRYKRGNQDKWAGKASVGLVSGKVSLGGPIFSEKLTLMLAGRTSYSNWILSSAEDARISNSEAGFYDGNAILDYDFSESMSLRYAFYRSFDDFKLAGNEAFEWSNQTHTVELNKNFGEKFLINLSATDVTYKSAIVDRSALANFRIDSDIRDQGLNLGFKFFFSDKNELAIGAQTKLISINPGDLLSTNSEFPINPFSVDKEKAMESGVYLQHDLEIGKLLGLSYGVRYNQFSFLGPGSVPNFDPLLPRNPENIVDFTTYNDGDKIITYNSLEPRASLRLSLGETLSFKAGYNKMFQYIHLISNTTTIAPTDTWKLSDPYLKPQEISQYSAGLFKNFNDNAFEMSVEVFYKDIQNILDYKDGVDLILNNTLSSDLLNGKGEAYGIEYYLEKKKGALTGWLSYTYLRSTRRIIGSFPEETINDGEIYASSFDKPHNLSIVADLKLAARFSVSSIFTYSTGRPVTQPTAKFDYLGVENIPYYNKRNDFRAPAYHRLDVAMTFSFAARRKWLQGDWVLSVYNIYGRKNAFSVFFDDIPFSPPQAFKLSVLGIPFPSLSYKFDF